MRHFLNKIEVLLLVFILTSCNNFGLEPFDYKDRGDVKETPINVDSALTIDDKRFFIRTDTGIPKYRNSLKPKNDDQENVDYIEQYISKENEKDKEKASKTTDVTE